MTFIRSFTATTLLTAVLLSVAASQTVRSDISDPNECKALGCTFTAFEECVCPKVARPILTPPAVQTTEKPPEPETTVGKAWSTEKPKKKKCSKKTMIRLQKRYKMMYEHWIKVQKWHDSYMLRKWKMWKKMWSEFQYSYEKEVKKCGYQHMYCSGKKWHEIKAQWHQHRKEWYKKKIQFVTTIEREKRKKWLIEKRKWKECQVRYKKKVVECGYKHRKCSDREWHAIKRDYCKKKKRYYIRKGKVARWNRIVWTNKANKWKRCKLRWKKYVHKCGYKHHKCSAKEWHVHKVWFYKQNKAWCKTKVVHNKRVVTKFKQRERRWVKCKKVYRKKVKQCGYKHMKCSRNEYRKIKIHFYKKKLRWCHVKKIYNKWVVKKYKKRKKKWRKCKLVYRKKMKQCGYKHMKCSRKQIRKIKITYYHKKKRWCKTKRTYVKYVEKRYDSRKKRWIRYKKVYKSKVKECGYKHRKCSRKEWRKIKIRHHVKKIHWCKTKKIHNRWVVKKYKKRKKRWIRCIKVYRKKVKQCGYKHRKCSRKEWRSIKIRHYHDKKSWCKTKRRHNKLVVKKYFHKKVSWKKCKQWYKKQVKKCGYKHKYCSDRKWSKIKFRLHRKKVSWCKTKRAYNKYVVKKYISRKKKWIVCKKRYRKQVKLCGYKHYRCSSKKWYKIRKTHHHDKRSWCKTKRSYHKYVEKRYYSKKRRWRSCKKVYRKKVKQCGYKHRRCSRKKWIKIRKTYYSDKRSWCKTKKIHNKYVVKRYISRKKRWIKCKKVYRKQVKKCGYKHYKCSSKEWSKIKIRHYHKKKRWCKTKRTYVKYVEKRYDSRKRRWIRYKKVYRSKVKACGYKHHKCSTKEWTKIKVRHYHKKKSWCKTKKIHYKYVENRYKHKKRIWKKCNLRYKIQVKKCGYRHKYCSRKKWRQIKIKRYLNKKTWCKAKKIYNKYVVNKYLRKKKSWKRCKLWYKKKKKSCGYRHKKCSKKEWSTVKIRYHSKQKSWCKTKRSYNKYVVKRYYSKKRRWGKTKIVYKEKIKQCGYKRRRCSRKQIRKIKITYHNKKRRWCKTKRTYVKYVEKRYNSRKRRWVKYQKVYRKQVKACGYKHRKCSSRKWRSIKIRRYKKKKSWCKTKRRHNKLIVQRYLRKQVVWGKCKKWYKKQVKKCGYKHKFCSDRKWSKIKFRLHKKKVSWCKTKKIYNKFVVKRYTNRKKRWTICKKRYRKQVKACGYKHRKCSSRKWRQIKIKRYINKKTWCKAKKIYNKYVVNKYISRKRRWKKCKTSYRKQVKRCGTRHKYCSSAKWHRIKRKHVRERRSWCGTRKTYNKYVVRRYTSRRKHYVKCKLRYKKQVKSCGVRHRKCSPRKWHKIRRSFHSKQKSWCKTKRGYNTFVVNRYRRKKRCWRQSKSRYQKQVKKCGYKHRKCSSSQWRSYSKTYRSKRSSWKNTVKSYSRFERRRYKTSKRCYQKSKQKYRSRVKKCGYKHRKCSSSQWHRYKTSRYRSKRSYSRCKKSYTSFKRSRTYTRHSKSWGLGRRTRSRTRTVTRTRTRIRHSSYNNKAAAEHATDAGAAEENSHIGLILGICAAVIFCLVVFIVVRYKFCVARAKKRKETSMRDDLLQFQAM